MRYSLRTLLVVVLVLGALAGWLGIRALRMRRQHEAVQAVKDAGGSVATAKAAAGVDPFTVPPTEPSNPIAKAAAQLEAPAWLRDVIGADGFERITSVDLSRKSVTDADLAHLRQLTNLKELFLSEADIGDVGLQNIGRLPELETLALDHTRVTDNGLRHLANFPKLKQLVLGGTSVGDDGLMHLRGASQLQNLDLASTQIRGPGLVHLKQLTQLQQLDVSGREISSEGLRHLSGISSLQWLAIGIGGVNEPTTDQFQKFSNLRFLHVRSPAPP